MVPARVATAVTVGESKRSGVSASLATRFREAEVEHLYRSVGPQLDIRRLEIAVDDSLLVGRFEGFGDLLRDGQRLVERDGVRASTAVRRSSPSTSSITRALTPSASFVQPVDGGDVRMIQRGEDFRFALKPRHSFRVSNEGLRQDLDGDIAIEPRVARPIHFAHPASPEGRENLVRTEARAIGQGHESGLILVVGPRPGKGETDCRRPFARCVTRFTTTKEDGNTRQ